MAASCSCAATSALVALLLSAAKQPGTLPSHREPGNTLPEERFDFIVVGGGTAGCVLAARLSEEPSWKVLLLEAGNEEPGVSIVPAFYTYMYTVPEWEWRYQTQPSNGLDKNQVVSRAKLLGGCSSHNGLTFLRGNKDDFEDWKKQGARGWGYEDVLPVFKQMESFKNLTVDTKYHGEHGPLFVQQPPYLDKNMKALLEAWKESGQPEVDPNAASQLGAFIAQQNSRRGQRFSTNRAYLEPARGRPNLRVVTGAHVKRILINHKTKRAEAVEYTDRDGKQQVVYATREIIISCGVYESPHMLMMSGVGPTKQLKPAGIDVVVDSPGVGRNLNDQHSSSFKLKLNITKSTVVPANAGQVWQDARAFLRGKGPFTTQGTDKVTSLQRSPLQPQSDARPYVQIISNSVLQRKEPLSSWCSPVNKSSAYYDQIIPAVAVLHPSSSGYLELNVSSPESPPLVYQNVFSEEIDLKIHARATWSLYQVYKNSSSLRELGATVTVPDVKGCEKPSKESIEYFECAVRGSKAFSFGHPTGTCRMGEDEEAVVDSRLRVRGVTNLRVVDASVMPSVPSGNPHSPTIMIAERGAKFVKEDWGSSRGYVLHH